MVATMYLDQRTTIRNPMPIILQPDKNTVLSALASAKRRLEEHPNYLTSLEQIGRILRWLGGGEASAYFQKAIDSYKFRPYTSGRDRPSDYVRVGNLYRLLGNKEEAHRCFARAFDLYSAELEEISTRKYADPSMGLEAMIMPAFLMGNDEIVAALIKQLQKYNKSTHLIAYPIAKLAAARLDENASKAEEAVDEFAKLVMRNKAEIWFSGGILEWDWYEIALEVWQELHAQSNLTG